MLSRASALELAAEAGKCLARCIQRIHRLAQLITNGQQASTLAHALAAKLAVTNVLLRTLDGKAFLVEKVTNSLQQRDIIRSVITATTAALQRTKRAELR